MKILVTGASGLIGSHLIDKLLEQHHEVYGFYRSTRNLNNKIVIAKVDLTNAEQTKNLIYAVKPDVVFHLAANVAEGKSQYFPKEITHNNIGIFMNVITPAIKSGMKRFVFFSSNAVYGEIKTPYKETDTPHPQDIYSINKLASENALRILAKVHGFEYIILRPHNVYGERQYMRDRYKNVVTLFMNHILRGEPYKLFGEGKLKRNFSYVKDVVETSIKCGLEGKSGEIFNVGSDESTSLFNLSFIIQQITGTDMKPLIGYERQQDVHKSIPSHEKVKALFGYHETPLREGLEKTWEWVKTQGAQDYDIDEPEL